MDEDKEREDAVSASHISRRHDQHAAVAPEPHTLYALVPAMMPAPAIMATTSVFMEMGGVWPQPPLLCGGRDRC